MIDSHCHFDFAPFAQAPNQYLAKAKQAGVNQLIIPTVGKENWQSVSLLAKNFADSVYFALGIHPLWVSSHKAQDIECLEALLKNSAPNLVAIGECGLDFAQPDANRKLQIDLLSKQFTLAVSLDIPVILHCRKAHQDLIRLINQFPQLRGVLHAFSGSEQQGLEYVKRGFYLGIGGSITFERANKTRQAVSNLPLSSLLLETDAPDMPIANQQGKANLPENLPTIAKELASLKNISTKNIEKQTTINTKALFRL